MARGITNNAYLADMNSAEVAEIVNAIADIYGIETHTYDGANHSLNSRRVLPRPDGSSEALARHRIQANEIGSRAQWFQMPGEEKPKLRLVGHKAGGGLHVGPELGSRHNLAAFGDKDSQRTRFALDLNELAPYFYTGMDEDVIEGRAKQKYAYINHRGQAAHHMLPISFMGRVKAGLQQLGIDSPVIDELLIRKMYQGDTSGNLAALNPNPDHKTPGAEGLEQVITPYDQHNDVHNTGENRLKDIQILNNDGSVNQEIDLFDFTAKADLNKKVKGKKDNYTPNTFNLRNIKEEEVSQFMNSNATDLQKQAVAMAIPQAHRLGLQDVMIPVSENSTASRKVRQVNEESILHSDVMKATTEFKPLTQQILSDMYGKRPETVDVPQSLRTYIRRR